MIHTLGDSHGKNTFENMPNVCIHWIGPYTMHRVGRDGLPLTKNLRACDTHMSGNDFLILSFGEIDARCHIFSQTSVGRDEDAVIQTLVANYFRSIDAAPINGKYVVMSIVPPAYYSRVYDNIELPFMGENEDRLRYTDKLNALLKQNCQERGILYLDVNNYYQDENGMLDKELSDGTVHIKDNIMVKQLLAMMHIS